MGDIDLTAESAATPAVVSRQKEGAQRPGFRKQKKKAKSADFQ